MTPARRKNTSAHEASGFFASDWKPGLTLQSGYPKDGPCPGCGVTIRKNAPNHKCSECRKGRRRATVQPDTDSPAPTLRYVVIRNGTPQTPPLALAKAESFRDQMQAASLAQGHTLAEVRYGVQTATTGRRHE